MLRKKQRFRRMECKHLKYCTFLSLLFCFLAEGLYASDFLQDGMFEPRNVQGRLLQILKPCPVNFELLNYTIITSQCKGPEYKAELCCKAFLEFACPYSEQVSDMTTDCATTMFSYITHNGKYPPGIFANMCSGNKIGVPCPVPPPSSLLEDDKGSHSITCIPSSILMVTTAFLVFLVQLF